MSENKEPRAASIPVTVSEFDSFVPSPFVAVNAKGMFFPEQQKLELARLYLKIFNNVNPHRPWAIEKSLNLLDELLRKPGSVTALFHNGKMIGAHYLYVVPLRNGPAATDDNLIIDPDYVRRGFDSEIWLYARQRADQVALIAFGESVQTSILQTYSNMDQPRKRWASFGHAEEDLYIASAREIAERTSSRVRGVTFAPLRENELEEARNLMCSHATLALDGDGSPWDALHAEKYLDYLQKYDGGIAQVAKRDGKIIALMAGRTTSRRTGVALVDIHGFTSDTTTIRLKSTLFTNLFTNLVRSADIICNQNNQSNPYNMALATVEVPGSSTESLAGLFPRGALKRDGATIIMRGTQEQMLTGYMLDMPKKNGRRARQWEYAA